MNSEKINKTAVKSTAMSSPMVKLSVVTVLLVLPLARTTNAQICEWAADDEGGGGGGWVGGRDVVEDEVEEEEEGWLKCKVATPLPRLHSLPQVSAFGYKKCLFVRHSPKLDK